MIGIRFGQVNHLLIFNNSFEQEWGINSNRYIPTSHEDIYWVTIPKNVTAWASRFGKLKGIKGVKQSTNRIEILPYASGGLDYHSSTNDDNPFSDDVEMTGNAGVDFKMGFGPNMTLDATINPDFGQVEADPATVNLTEFETYYDEKRPFFIEGNTLFTNAGANYFYSRRIGGHPHYSPAEADYIDMPRRTSIPLAAKLTGRTVTGMQYGLLSAITMEEFADCYISDSDSTYETMVEPLTAYNVFRLKQEIGDYGSSFGAIVTGVNRNIDKDDDMASLLNQNAYSGGLDWDLYLDQKKYRLYGFLGASAVNGTTEQMINLQRNPTHNFGRPDATHLSIDSSLTTLGGMSGSIRLERTTAKHWFWNVGTNFESPGFELNDIGRLQHGDAINFSSGITYKELKPSDLFYRYSIGLSAEQNFNYNMDYLATPLHLYSSCTFSSMHGAYVNLHYTPESKNDTKSRGGPMVGIPATFVVSTGFNSDYAAKNSWYVSGRILQDALDGYSREGSAGVTVNFTRSKIDFSANYREQQDMRQYVTTMSGGLEETFGNRYIFGGIERKTLSGTLRFDYSFTPDITFELYAQPFASNGNYFSYGEMIDPGSTDWKEYGKADGTTIEKNENRAYTVTDGDKEFQLRDYDFNYISFRSSAVFRWEFRPGSTFYLVWQLNNSEYSSQAGRVDFGSLRNGFSAPGINSVAAKISWWIPVGS
jgi:hypothetical protein